MGCLGKEQRHIEIDKPKVSCMLFIVVQTTSFDYPSPCVLGV